ncbi:hypothetical protein WICPIJ_009653 [Wickerhamomyces pijperi]|uniref:Uncharacterized protein n=1 Tax=Wickerhamomyces pijperi TaxID=599730 RepID=A0A9P8TBV6_WICPI|nr:hypothetical protein WICPIJ_009653 [Wickerhamomyces pijperi]
MREFAKPTAYCSNTLASNFFTGINFTDEIQQPISSNLIEIAQDVVLIQESIHLNIFTFGMFDLRYEQVINQTGTNTQVIDLTTANDEDLFNLRKTSQHLHSTLDRILKLDTFDWFHSGQILSCYNDVHSLRQWSELYRNGVPSPTTHNDGILFTWICCDGGN